MSAPPRVSVILPAYYSDDTIGECLQAIATQTFRDYEIIVVNSSPEVRTHEIISSRYPQVSFRQNPVRLLPHAARNLGVSLSHGELFAFTDPDCLPHPDWLAHLVRASDEGHAVLVGGMEVMNRTWLARGIHMCKWFWLLSQLPPSSPWIIATGNACLSRRAWEAIGPLDGELYNGDALWGWRARAIGFPPWFEPRAVVDQIHRQTLAEVLRERYIRGKEFAIMRAGYERWSRGRALSYAFAIPFLLIVILWRTFRAAQMAGWMPDFWLTIPISILGQLAWLFGESRSYLAYALSKSSLQSQRPNG